MKTQLKNEVNLIAHLGIRELVERALETCPGCFWTMPAATTGKYHPAISLGTGGLIRHTKAVVRLTCHLLYMVGLNEEHPGYSIAIAAAILHDCCKKNDSEKYTAFDHPLRAVKHIEATAATLTPGIVSSDDLRRLCDCVGQHMGRWNTSPQYHPGITLPLPVQALPRLVHTADYLASRKDITLDGIA